MHQKHPSHVCPAVSVVVKEGNECKEGKEAKKGKKGKKRQKTDKI
jgi:hypothetical protein